MVRKLLGTGAQRLLGLRRPQNPQTKWSLERKVAPPADDAAPDQGHSERWSTLQLGAVMAVIALGAKLIMMYDESQEPARIARRAREFAEAQENLKPITPEQWQALQQIRPLTPFDGPVDTARARIRTGRLPSWGDFRDWAVDSVSEALEQNESPRH